MDVSQVKQQQSLVVAETDTQLSSHPCLCLCAGLSPDLPEGISKSRARDLRQDGGEAAEPAEACPKEAPKSLATAKGGIARACHRQSPQVLIQGVIGLHVTVGLNTQN